MHLPVVLLLAIFALGQSQTPSPTPSKTAHANQKKAESEQGKSTTNDDATKQLTSAINQLTAAVAARNEQDFAAQSNNKTPAPRWLITSTIVSALATLAIAILSFFQWRAMRKQAEYMHNGLTETIKVANAAKDSAEAAARQAAVAESQNERSLVRERDDARRYGEQLALAQENAATAKLSADALVAAESAWIMVDVIWSSGSKGVINGTKDGLPTSGVAVDIIYRNEGKTLAWIVEERAALMIVDSILAGPNMDAIPLITTEPHGIAPSGKFIEERAWLACNGIASTSQATIIYGVARYRDIFDRKRETTFGYVLTASNDLERLPAHRAYNRHT